MVKKTMTSAHILDPGRALQTLLDMTKSGDPLEQCQARLMLGIHVVFQDWIDDERHRRTDPIFCIRAGQFAAAFIAYNTTVNVIPDVTDPRRLELLGILKREFDRALDRMDATFQQAAHQFYKPVNDNGSNRPH